MFQLCNVNNTRELVLKVFSFYLDSLPRPTMYIYTATPTSLQANWIKTDVPMDSWIVRIYSAEHVTFDENGEREYIQVKTGQYRVSSVCCICVFASYKKQKIPVYHKSQQFSAKMKRTSRFQTIKAY